MAGNEIAGILQPEAPLQRGFRQVSGLRDQRQDQRRGMPVAAGRAEPVPPPSGAPPAAARRRRRQGRTRSCPAKCAATAWGRRRVRPVDVGGDVGRPPPQASTNNTASQPKRGIASQPDQRDGGQCRYRARPALEAALRPTAAEQRTGRRWRRPPRRRRDRPAQRRTASAAARRTRHVQHAAAIEARAAHDAAPFPAHRRADDDRRGRRTRIRRRAQQPRPRRCQRRAPETMRSFSS